MYQWVSGLRVCLERLAYFIRSLIFTKALGQSLQCSIRSTVLIITLFSLQRQLKAARAVASIPQLISSRSITHFFRTKLIASFLIMFWSLNITSQSLKSQRMVVCGREKSNRFRISISSSTYSAEVKVNLERWLSLWSLMQQISLILEDRMRQAAAALETRLGVSCFHLREMYLSKQRMAWKRVSSSTFMRSCTENIHSISEFLARKRGSEGEEQGQRIFSIWLLQVWKMEEKQQEKSSVEGEDSQRGSCSLRRSSREECFWRLVASLRIMGLELYSILIQKWGTYYRNIIEITIPRYFKLSQPYFPYPVYSNQYLSIIMGRSKRDKGKDRSRSPSSASTNGLRLKFYLLKVQSPRQLEFLESKFLLIKQGQHSLFADTSNTFSRVIVYSLKEERLVGRVKVKSDAQKIGNLYLLKDIQDIQYEHFVEVEWERKVNLPKKRLSQFLFVDKQTAEFEEITQIDGERFSDFMDYPEDYKRSVAYLPIKPMFPMTLPGVPFPIPSFCQPQDPLAGYLDLGKSKKKKTKREKDKSEDSDEQSEDDDSNDSRRERKRRRSERDRSERDRRKYRSSKQKSRKDRDREKEKDREREKERERERDKSKDKDRNKEKKKRGRDYDSRSRDRKSRDRKKEDRDRKSKERRKDSRDRRRSKSNERSKDRDKSKERSRYKKYERERSSRNKDKERERQKRKDKGRERQKNRDKDKDREKEKERDRDREKQRGKDKDRSKEEQREKEKASSRGNDERDRRPKDQTDSRGGSEGKVPSTSKDKNRQGSLPHQLDTNPPKQTVSSNRPSESYSLSSGSQIVENVTDDMEIKKDKKPIQSRFK